MKITLHMLATLIVVGMLSGGALSLVNDWASPLIEENQRKIRDEAIGFLVPGGAPHEVVSEGKLTAWQVRDGDTVLGWVVQYAGIGFQAEISLMIALDAEREEIRGLKVLDDSETPGLGTWIRLSGAQEEALREASDRYLGAEVEKAQNFPLQFFSFAADKHLSAGGDLKVVKGKPRDQLGPTEVQSITAATISSVAVVDIVNEAVVKLDQLLAAQGGV
jgi:electron transport complex protein RnfG